MTEEKTYLVPSDTRAILDKLHPDMPEKNASIAHKCDNLALILSRYIPREIVNDEEVERKSPRPVKPDKIDKVKRKPEWLVHLIKNINFSHNKKDESKKPSLREILENYKNRWEAMVQAYGAEPFEMQLRGRMAVGLGGKNPLEFGITLDKLTGLPYIPGSALKGLARSYALLTLAAYKNIPITTDKAPSNNEKTPLELFEEAVLAGDYNSEHDDKNFPAGYYQLVFGTPDEAGRCVFFDAVVSDTKGQLFANEIMTPHFGEYYTASDEDRKNNNPKKAPHDADNPTPIGYVAVNAGVVFKFAVGIRTGVKGEFDTQAQAIQWLQGGLAEMGIGAKTAQGYGVFKDIRGDNS